MESINVQFSDASEATIVSYFACPQDAAVFPNQGIISSSDQRWTAYFNATGKLIQESLPQPTA